MASDRAYRTVGIALIGFGVLIFAIGITGGAGSLRLAGPVLIFLGVVMIARSRRF